MSAGLGVRALVNVCPEQKQSSPRVLLPRAGVQIKEEPEEQSIKQEEEQLPVCVLESSAVCVKKEESTEENISSEPHFHSETEGRSELSSDTDNDDDWETFSGSAAKSTGLFPKYKSVPETSASVTEEEGAEGKKFQCSVCNKRFKQKEKLQVHYRRHTGERPFSCTVCEKAFSSKYALKLHMVQHTGELPYSCSVCAKAFAQKCRRKRHMRTHTGEKPFTCSICKKSFSQKRSLNSHMTKVNCCLKTQSAEKADPPVSSPAAERFNCSVCEKTFLLKSALDKHERTHTGAKPFSCSLCKKTFGQKSALQTHMSSHTGGGGSFFNRFLLSRPKQ